MKRQRTKGSNNISLSEALIICNGELLKRLINRFTDLNKPRRQLEIIAADGASDFLYRHRIIPHAIIGDLDSISPAAKKYFTAKKVKIKRIAGQNRNDFEKCITYALSKGKKKISIIGFSGKRFDHSVNNLSILKKFSRKADLTVYEGDFEYFFINKKTEFTCKPGDIVSLIALPKATGITTNGLKYPLKNETLELGVREGALNEASNKAVSIKFRAGHLLLIKKLV